MLQEVKSAATKLLLTTDSITDGDLATSYLYPGYRLRPRTEANLRPATTAEAQQKALMRYMEQLDNAVIRREMIKLVTENWGMLQLRLAAVTPAAENTWAVIQMAAKKSGPKVPFVALEEAYYVIKGAIFDRTTSQARAMSDVSCRLCCCFHARENPFHMPFDCTPHTVPSASLFTRSICSPTTPHPRAAAPPSP